jgi:hypothetical protein
MESTSNNPIQTIPNLPAVTSVEEPVVHKGKAMAGPVTAALVLAALATLITPQTAAMILACLILTLGATWTLQEVIPVMARLTGTTPRMMAHLVWMIPAATIAATQGVMTLMTIPVGIAMMALMAAEMIQVTKERRERALEAKTLQRILERGKIPALPVKALTTTSAATRTKPDSSRSAIANTSTASSCAKTV